MRQDRLHPKGTHMSKDNLTLTTQKNGRTMEWITIIEDGIPVWVRKNSIKKHELMKKLEQLIHQAMELEDDEPVIELRCTTGERYQISYFHYASLYLCEELEGRYSTLSTLMDALWELPGMESAENCHLV